MVCGVFLFAEDRPAKVVYEDDHIRVEAKSDARPASTAKREKDRSDEPKPEEIVPRTYPIADVLTFVPTPAAKQGLSSKPAQPRFQPLIEHLRRSTGADHWRDEQTSMRFYETTLSLVIRQTPEIHERIVGELSRLRRNQAVTVTVAITFVAGPRRELQELTASFAGE